MPEVMRCPGCNRLIRIDETLRDRQVQCPNCQEIFRVGTAGGQISASPPPAPRPSREQYAEQPLRSRPRDLPARETGDEKDWDDLGEVPAYSDYVRRRLPAGLSGGGLAVTACILFAGVILLDVAMLFHHQSTLELLRKAPFINPAEADAHDRREVMLALVMLAVAIVLVIVFLMWIYRAYANLELFGLRELRFSPGWAVGYWFIPFVNLVRPVQVVQEIWRGSSPAVPPDNPQAWTSERGSVRVGFWWLFYLASGFIGAIGSFMETEAARVGDIPQLQRATTWLITSNAASIVAAIFAIFVVLGIHSRQAQKFRQLTTPSEDWTS